MRIEGERTTLIISASRRAREGASSPLIRFVRDYTSLLKRFTIYATEGTGSAILSTGLYTPNADIVRKLPGYQGGTAQLAAIVARGECNIVILLLDPSDPWTDAVE